MTKDELIVSRHSPDGQSPYWNIETNTGVLVEGPFTSEGAAQERLDSMDERTMTKALRRLGLFNDLDRVTGT